MIVVLRSWFFVMGEERKSFEAALLLDVCAQQGHVYFQPAVKGVSALKQNRRYAVVARRRRIGTAAPPSGGSLAAGRLGMAGHGRAWPCGRPPSHEACHEAEAMRAMSLALAGRREAESGGYREKQRAGERAGLHRYSSPAPHRAAPPRPELGSLQAKVTASWGGPLRDPAD